MGGRSWEARRCEGEVGAASDAALLGYWRRWAGRRWKDVGGGVVWGERRSWDGLWCEVEDESVGWVLI